MIKKFLSFLLCFGLVGYPLTCHAGIGTSPGGFNQKGALTALATLAAVVGGVWVLAQMYNEYADKVEESDFEAFTEKPEVHHHQEHAEQSLTEDSEEEGQTEASAQEEYFEQVEQQETQPAPVKESVSHEKEVEQEVIERVQEDGLDIFEDEDDEFEIDDEDEYDSEE